MQINELPSLGRALQSGDQMAVDDANGITYKVDAENINPTPSAISIPASRWSGSGSDYYITVTASNVTADSILIPQYDVASAALLNGPVWCVPAAGSFTIHTSAIPSGTVTILVLFPGTMGEAHYEVLADVYSKSQVDSIVAQSTAITSGKLTALNGASIPDVTGNHYEKSGKVVTGFFRFTSPSTVSQDLIVAQLPVGFRPKNYMLFPAITPWMPDAVFIIRIDANGNISLPSTAWTASRNYAFSFVFVTD